MNLIKIIIIIIIIILFCVNLK